MLNIELADKKMQLVIHLLLFKLRRKKRNPNLLIYMTSNNHSTLFFQIMQQKKSAFQEQTHQPSCQYILMRKRRAI